MIDITKIKPNTFGTFIRDMRLNKNITRLALCNNANINLIRYSEIERDRINPNDSEIYKISIGLDIKTELEIDAYYAWTLTINDRKISPPSENDLSEMLPVFVCRNEDGEQPSEDELRALYESLEEYLGL